MTKKNYNFLTKAALVLLTLLFVPLGMMGQTNGSATLTWSEQGLDNAASVDGVAYDLGDYFTVTCNKNSASTAPTYYTSGTAVRCYATKNTNNGNTIVVAKKSSVTENVFITKVEYNGTHNKKGTTSFAYSGSPSETTTTSASYDEGDQVTTASATLCETGGNANGQFYCTSVTVEYVVVSADVPSISLSPASVDVPYTGGNGTLTLTTANLAADPQLDVMFYDMDGEWITWNFDNDGNVAYTVEENTATEARTGSLKVQGYDADQNLIYSNGVTFTQAAAPVVYTTIPALFGAATGTATNVSVKFDGWVVTGVSSYNAYVTDGINGFVINASNHGFEVGNTLTSSAALACSLQLKNGYAQVTGITSATEGLTVGTGGSVDVANIAMADLAGVNTGALVSYENLTCSVDNSGNTPKYYLTDGTTTLQIYTTLYSDLASSLEDGKTYNITGVYQQYNTTKEILPRDADDIEEVVGEDPLITVEQPDVNVVVEGGDGTINITYENFTDNKEVTLLIQDEAGAPAEFDWLDAELDNNNNVYYVVGANTETEERTAYLQVVVADNFETYYSEMITITQAAYLPKWIVTFNTDGGEFVPNNDFTDEIVEVEQGTHYLPSATKEGYRLEGWNDGNITYAAGANYDFTSDVEFTAVWVEKGVEEWVLTNIDDIEEGDVFVIVGNNGSDYAMTNDNGASAPLPVAVTVENEKITSAVDDNIQWNIEVGTNGFIFRPNGSTTTSLYCIDNNNGLRVGAGSGTFSNTFVLDESGYLKTTVNSNDRFVGIYTAANATAPQDWRSYKNTTGNIAGQTFAFYKKVETYPAQTVTLTIKGGFTATTFSSDKALDFSGFETLKAFIITDGDGTTVQVSKVPANTGIYVTADEANDYDVPILFDESEAEDVTGNLLVATDGETTYVSDNETVYYIFGKQKGKEAFFKVPAAGYTPSANKAALAVPASAGAKEMIVIGGEATAIDNSQFTIDNLNGECFDLSGRKVSNGKLQKGIYIVNGRKVVVK